MAGPTSRSPRLRDILLGVIALVVLIVAFINLGAVVKLAGAGFMVIPSALGIVQRVSSREVFTYDMSRSPTMVGISQPGRYAVYAYDSDLLTTSDQLEQSNAAPWITLKSEISGETVPVAFVKRGMRPYDTFLAKGRPVLSFVITSPGVYVMLHPARPAPISVVRDYVTGNERALALAFLAQIGVVVIPLVFVYARRYLTRLDARKAAQRRKRQQSEEFWRDQALRSHTWRRPK
jgi:hypothetical protein